jgi:hypothetical protein
MVSLSLSLACFSFPIFVIVWNSASLNPRLFIPLVTPHENIHKGHYPAQLPHLSCIFYFTSLGTFSLLISRYPHKRCYITSEILSDLKK